MSVFFSDKTLVNDPELQIRWAFDDNSKIFLLISQHNICCDPSLEPSQQDGSNERATTYGFMEKYGKLSLNYSCYAFLSGALSYLKCLNGPIRTYRYRIGRGFKGEWISLPFFKGT